MGRKFDPEYKQYVARMVVEEGRGVAETSRETNRSETVIRRWVKEYKEETGWVDDYKEKKKKEAEAPSYKTPTDYEKELKDKEKEINRLARENQILKKAMHVFTENHE